MNTQNELVERLQATLQAIDFQHGVCGEWGCRLCEAFYKGDELLEKLGVELFEVI